MTTPAIVKMGPRELEARSALLVLYLEVSSSVAEDVGRRVIAAFDEIREETERRQQRIERLEELIRADHTDGAFYSCDECGTSFGRTFPTGCPVCDLAASQAETERLRAALRPLAELYEADPEWVEEECLDDIRRIATALGPIRFNDVKRAWAALRPRSGNTP